MGYYGRGGAKRIGNATHEQTVAGWLAGKDVRGSRMFSERGVIYSYGYHFAIARLVEKDGRELALITRDSYSSTTSGHVSRVRSALYRRGIETLDSDTMDENDRRGDALALARAALELMHDKRRCLDLWHTRKAQGLMTTAERHGELAGGVPELAELRRDLDSRVANYEQRCARIFGAATGKAFFDLFVMEGLTGEFISSGAYMVPNHDRMERRLCAYWRVSDGRFARIIKDGRDLKTTFMDTLPSDLAAGV